uniref:Uncharacterized protein n=1 Tax=Anguilla anguilla TaxID=7936 RepID=A0A0E9Q9F9_ANGAN
MNLQEEASCTVLLKIPALCFHVNYSWEKLYCLGTKYTATVKL